MKRIAGFFCIILMAAAGTAVAESFLEPASFPKTINDVSFNDRMKNLADGYEPFETEFDEQGRCISGCPYQGFTLEDQLAQIQRDEEISRVLFNEANMQNPTTNPVLGTNILPEVIIQPEITPQIDVSLPPELSSPTTQPSPPITSITPPAHNTPPPSGTPAQQIPAGDGARHCSVFLAGNRVGATGPQGEPLANCPRISSRYGFRTHPVTGERGKMHHAVDIPVPVGTNVYATGDGVVVSAVTNEKQDGCGRYIKIRHTNGMYSLYCHLDKILVKQNETVQSGCMIAKSGNTGRTTGTHLHYAVLLKNGNSVDPEKWMSCKHKH